MYPKDQSKLFVCSRKLLPEVVQFSNKFFLGGRVASSTWDLIHELS